MTRQGDLLASAVIEGLDSFTSDDGELDVAGQSFARLVGQLGDGFGYHVNKITIPETIALRSFVGDSFEAEVDRHWRDHLTSRHYKRRVILLTDCLRPMIGGRLPIIGSIVKSTFTGSLPGRKDRLNEAMGLLAGMYQSLGFRRLAVSDGEWLGLLAAVQGQSYGKIIAGPGQFIAQTMTAVDVNFTGKRFEIEGAGTPRHGAIFVSVRSDCG